MSVINTSRCQLLVLITIIYRASYANSLINNYMNFFFIVFGNRTLLGIFRYSEVNIRESKVNKIW